MRFPLAFLIAAVPAMAQAHPGHLADLAGHDHWVAGAAIGIAVVLGAWVAVKGSGKPSREATEDDETAAADAQDA